MPNIVAIKAKVYSGITESQRNLFERTYNRHLNSWGTEKRSLYTLNQLQVVMWDVKEGYLKVYFKNGDWWHYCTDGTWF